MKHFVMIIALILCGVNGMAQLSERQFSLAVRAGYNHAIVRGATCEDSQWKPGFNVGFTADYNLSDIVALRSGLYYTEKGYQYKETDDVFPYNYMELPLLAVLKKDIKSGLAMEFQAGTFFSYGIGGTAKLNGSKNQEYFTLDPSTGELKRITYQDKIFDDRDRFDWGFNAGLGIDINHFYLGMAFEMGVTNLFNHAHHYCLMANVGYTF